MANIKVDFIHSSKSSLYSETDNIEDYTTNLVSPGTVITQDSMFMRGHGTFSEETKLISTLSGYIDKVNKLICVQPMKSRYSGEIGDVIVGRIVEVSQKKWKVDSNSTQDAILLLSSINLPGGILRRKSESDELQMRSFFVEGDLLSAEVQTIYQDGALSLHTRNFKYGKLRNGCFVSVPPVLIKRCKSHFHDLSCGVSVILGVNGYIWVSKTVQKDPEEEETEYSYSNLNEEITDEERSRIARIANCIKALASQYMSIHDTSIMFTYEHSLKYKVQELLEPDVIDTITHLTNKQLQMMVVDE